MVTALALALCLQAPGPAPASELRCDEAQGVLCVSLGHGVEVHRSHAPFAWRRVVVGETTLRASPGAAGYRVNRRRPEVTLVERRVERDRVELDLGFVEGDTRFTATETLRSVQVGGAVGLARSIHWRRPPECQDSMEATTLSVAPLGLQPGRAWVDVWAHYGQSRVSEPGLTYGVWRTSADDGATVWVYHAGHAEQAQDTNGHVPVEEVEVVLVAPPGVALHLGDLFDALVEHPFDRRDLLRSHAPARYREQYEEPVVRHLDPVRGTRWGRGTALDPWPSFERCEALGRTWLLAPGSRLVLHGGAHGAVRRLRSGVTLEAAFGERAVVDRIEVDGVEDVTLRGLVVQRAEDDDGTAPLVRIGRERGVRDVLVDGLEVIGAAAASEDVARDSPMHARLPTGIEVGVHAVWVTLRDNHIARTRIGLSLGGPDTLCEANVVEEAQQCGIRVPSGRARVADNVIALPRDGAREAAGAAPVAIERAPFDADDPAPEAVVFERNLVLAPLQGYDLALADALEAAHGRYAARGRVERIRARLRPSEPTPESARRAPQDAPVVRHLDPTHGSLANAGTRAAPWPGLGEVCGAGVLAALRPGSRLVLHDGDHGALSLRSDGVTLEPAPNARPRVSSIQVEHCQDVVLRGLSIEAPREHDGLAALVRIGAEHPTTNILVEGCRVIGAVESGNLAVADPRSVAPCVLLGEHGRELTLRNLDVSGGQGGIVLAAPGSRCEGCRVASFDAPSIAVLADGVVVDGNVVVMPERRRETRPIFAIALGRPSGTQALRDLRIERNAIVPPAVAHRARAAFEWAIDFPALSVEGAARSAAEAPPPALLGARVRANLFAAGRFSPPPAQGGTVFDGNIPRQDPTFPDRFAALARALEAEFGPRIGPDERGRFPWRPDE